MDFTIKQELLCSWIWDNTDKNKEKIDILVDKIKEKCNYDENQLEQIKNKLLNNFLASYNKKWNKATRNRLTFVRQFKQFINNLFIVDFVSISHPSNSANSPNKLDNSLLNKRGRSRLSYYEGSDKTKRRRIRELLEKYTDEELTRATDSLHTNLINQSASKKKIKKTEKDINGSLAMYMDLEMTRDKYEKLRIYNEDLHGDKLYPPYEDIREAKKNVIQKILL